MTLSSFIFRSLFFLLLTFVTGIPYSFGQAEFSKWFFGTNAALDHSTSPPSPILGSAMSTSEGCASIADANGDLLFYTDGIEVWDQTHSVMPNGSGLMGDGSSTQSGVIVPVPGKSSQYYIFTADQGGYGGTNQGIHYSVVDMSLQGGNGDVTTKNVVVMDDSATEKIVAVPRCDSSFWVVTHKFHTDEFYAYPVDSSGVGAPVISSVGVVHQNISSYSNTIGYLKVSPDRRKLGLAIWGPSNMAGVYDFNPNTGVVSDPVEVDYNNLPSSSSGPYGVSFSPNSERFYVSINGNMGSHNSLFQYDLSSNDSAVIVASETEVNPGDTGSFGALQLAPDGMIYATDVTESLDVIKDPNALGMACGFVEDSVSVNTNSSNNTTTLGLPNFVYAFQTAQDPQIAPSSQVLCGPSDSVMLEAPLGNSYDWSTGDTVQTITVTDTGSYWVTVTDSSSSCGTVKMDTVHLEYFDKDLEISDRSFCEGDSVDVTVDPIWTSQDWSTGASGPSLSIDSGGSYWVETQRYQCVRSDSFQVEEIPRPQARIEGDTVICRNSVSELTAYPSGESYQWSMGDDSRVVEISGGGTYWVTVDRSGCQDSDTMDVRGEDCEVVIKMPNVFTPNEDGSNDRMVPKELQNIESLNAQVYNRWGQKVHFSEEKKIEWDGTDLEGREVPEGTYFWELEYFGKDGSKGELTGSVELLR